MAQGGNVRGGLICDVDLQVTPGELGDVLSIFFSQAANSTDTWKLQVACGTDQGLNIVGQIITRPPAVAGEPPSRMVAVAMVPGAKRWRVSCSTERQGAEAWIQLQSSRQGGAGIPPGVTAVKNGTQSPDGNFQLSDTTGAVMQAGPVSPAGGLVGSTLFSIDGTMRSAQIATANTFVMIFDQLAPPVLGDIPVWSEHLGGPAVANAPIDDTHYLYQPPGGRLIVNRLWVSTSSTPDTYTPDFAVNSVSVHAVLGVRG